MRSPIKLTPGTMNTPAASKIPITDTGEYFEGTDVETALQEAGQYITELTDNTTLVNTVATPSVSGGVFTITLTQPDGLNLEFNIDSTHLPHNSDTMALDITSFAGTDAVPKTIYVYVINTAGSPVLTASNTNPEGVIEHVYIGNVKVGTVGASSATVYGGFSSPVDSYEIAARIWHKFFTNGAHYLSGMEITATASNVTVGAGSMDIVFDTLSTVEKAVGTDGIFSISNAGAYTTQTDFAFTKYATGEAISSNKAYNVIIGYVWSSAGSGKLMALVQKGDMIPSGKEYKNVKEATEDKYGTLVLSPSDNLLKRLFTPVCRVVVINDVLQELPEVGTGIYAIDLRGENGGGGGSVATASNTDAGTADNDSLFWNDTDGVYEAKTPEEARAILDVPDVAKVNPLALSQGVTLTAASSGSNGIQVANNDDINFGTGDFTLCWVGSLPDWAPGETIHLFYKNTSGINLSLSVVADGRLRLNLINAGVTRTYISSLPLTFSPFSIHHFVSSISVGLTQTTVMLSIDSQQYDVLSPQNNLDVNNAAPLFIIGTEEKRYQANTLAAYAYNYALDADQVKDLYRNGVALSDRDGSMTELGNGAWQNGYSPASWESFISTGYDSFVASNSISDDEIRIIVPINTLKIGKKYQIVFTPINVKDTTLDYIHQSTSAYSGSGEISRNINISSSVKQSFIFIATYAATHIMFIMSPLAGGEFSISDFSIIEAGTTLRLEPENIQLSPGQWLDAANGHHAKLPAEGSTLTRPQKEGFIEWTNEWTASSTAQYIGGINEDIFPEEDIRINYINMKCSAIGTHITIGDESDDNRYVKSTELTNELDIGSPDHVNHDGTHRKLLIKPSSIFTGSIKTTIKYILA